MINSIVDWLQGNLNGTPSSSNKIQVTMSKETSTKDMLLSLKAPSETTHRNGVDVIFVIDRSGSMDEMATKMRSKMRLLCDTLKFAISHFTEQDRVSVVTFDDDVEVITDLNEMTDNRKSYTIKQIESIIPRGSTNNRFQFKMGHLILISI